MIGRTAVVLVLVGSGCSGGDRPAVLGATDAKDAGATVPVVPWDGGPTNVPLRVASLVVADLDGGPTFAGYRLALDLGVGPSTLTGFLDTGSEGVQLLASALPAEATASLTRTATSVGEEFQSGVVATGVLAGASITLGDRTTPSPIPVLLVESFSCLDAAACTAATAPLSSYLFGDYQAIVGVGLRNSSAGLALGSPIPQLPGQPSFIVEAPSFGGTSGTLHIGPAPTELDAYHLLSLPPAAGAGALANGTPGWDDSAVPAACTIAPVVVTTAPTPSSTRAAPRRSSSGRGRRCRTCCRRRPTSGSASGPRTTPSARSTSSSGTARSRVSIGSACWPPRRAAATLSIWG
ncbi:MAG: hypothetical protein JOZ69_05490 [Myxococcales bacterium]|nr:hypothetical protein [Myxococcales bacterium]